MTTTATVETLTAEVRVLMVGNRQITLSVAKQLDRMMWMFDATPEEFEPFGRIRAGITVGRTRKLHRAPRKLTDRHWSSADGKWYEDFEGEPTFTFIGRRRADGALAVYIADRPYDGFTDDDERAEWDELTRWDEDLPLIVLAGIR